MDDVWRFFWSTLLTRPCAESATCRPNEAVCIHLMTALLLRCVKCWQQAWLRFISVCLGLAWVAAECECLYNCPWGSWHNNPRYRMQQIKHQDTRTRFQAGYARSMDWGSEAGGDWALESCLIQPAAPFKWCGDPTTIFIACNARSST